MKVFILGVCLSFSLWASDPYFVEALKLDQSKSLEVVKSEMRNVIALNKHHISLGESHLHPFTAREVQKIFTQLYVDEATDFRFCSESISDFLDHESGQMLQDYSRDTLITKKNGPHQTDFKECRNNKFENYFTYAGFFHLLPFARPFLKEFPATPVVIRDDENIRAQMKIKNEYYVIQMELEYLEFITQARLLREPATSLEAWKNQLQQLTKKIEEIKHKQELLVAADISERTKLGVFVPLEQRVTFVVTDLAYRKKLPALPFMQQMMKLSKPALENLLRHLRKSPVYLNAAIQEPSRSGELSETGYGTLPWTFPANSFFLEARIVPGENLVMIAAPTTQTMTCIAYKSLGASLVDCEDYLSDLP